MSLIIDDKRNTRMSFIKNKVFGLCLFLVIGGLLLMVHYSDIFIQHRPNRPTMISKQDPTNISEQDTTNITILKEDIRCNMKTQLKQLYSKLFKQHAKHTTLQELKKMINSLNCSSLLEEKEEKINKLLDVCPEKYMGSQYGLPYGYKQGFIIEKCKNVKPFPSVITILFETVYSLYKRDTIIYILKEIEELYPNLNVFLAITQSLAFKIPLISKLKIKTFEFSNKDSLGLILNQLIKQVQTPYVYIIRDIDDFTYHVRLERLVRVLSNNEDVAVAGGSYRQSEGYWSRNCFQTKMSNYFLHYDEGYEHSLNECMYCDYLCGSFAAKTHILKNITFDPNIYSEIIFEDFFIQVREGEYLVWSCPDVMSFLQENNMAKTRSAWVSLAKKYELNKIILENGTSITISCEEVKQTCNAYSLVKSYMLPLCCQEKIVQSMQNIANYLDQHNMSYYIIDGTLLGAVKLGIPLPWDIDSDIIMDSQDSEFINNNSSIWTRRGFTSVVYSTVSEPLARFINFRARIYYNNLYFELFSTHNTSDYTDLKYKQVPTKIKFSNIYLHTPINPGLVSRNQYGRECLKHVQSWTAIGQGMWSDYKAGSFLPCNKPKHHACLDHFQTDGNFDFRIP